MRRHIAPTALVVLFLILSNVVAGSQYPSAKGREAGLCGEIVGETEADMAHLKAFCAKGLDPGTVIGAMARDSILTLKVSREFANGMRADRLSTEQLIKIWMRVWRQLTTRKAVSIQVEWQDVEIATGDTTFLGGDRVTIRP